MKLDLRKTRKTNNATVITVMILFLTVKFESCPFGQVDENADLCLKIDKGIVKPVLVDFS